MTDLQNEQIEEAEDIHDAFHQTERDVASIIHRKPIEFLDRVNNHTRANVWLKADTAPACTNRFDL